MNFKIKIILLNVSKINTHNKINWKKKNFLNFF